MLDARALLSGALGAALLVATQGTLAGDWTITPRLSLETTYTDNITLQSGDDRRGSTVLTASPGVSVRGEGARVQANAAYSLQRLEYGRDEFDGQTSHRLQAGGSVEIVERLLTVDASASAGQQNTAGFGRGGRPATSNISRTGDTQDVYTFQVQPILRHRLGSWAAVDARVGYNEVRTEAVNGEAGRTSGDSTGTQASVSVASGREFPNLPWSLTYSRSEVESDEGRTLAGGGTQGDTNFSSISGTLRYNLNRRLQPFVTLGYTDNEFETRNSDRQSGRTWRAGVTWTPSSRSSVQIGYGEEPFGESLSLDATLERRRSVITARYSQRLTTQRELQLEEVFIPLTDPFGNPIVDPLSGRLIGIPIVGVRGTDEVLVNEAFKASYALRGKRSTVTVGASWDERVFETSSESDRYASLNVSVDRSLSRMVTGTLSARLEESDRFDADDTGTLWELNLRLAYRLAENVSADVALTHVQSDGFGEGGGLSESYEENRITAGIAMTF